MTAVIVAVCVRRTWTELPRGQHSAIDKAAVPGRVAVVHDRGGGRGPGLVGDAVGNRAVHGGVGKAVYAYGDEDAAWWEAELGITIPAGSFGENLRTAGIDLDGLVPGQQLTVGAGGLVLAVSGIRTPCVTFARHMGQPQWVKRFAMRGRAGAYLRIVAEGDVGAGDEIVVGAVPAGPTIGELFAAKYARTGP
jgi:MOSC domain-containing protein YiiM